MFMILLTFDGPKEEIDRVRPDHIKWLDKYYGDGTLVASGPRLPRVGGIAVAKGMDEAAMKAMLAEEPYAKAGLARHELFQFEANRARDGAEDLVGA